MDAYKIKRVLEHLEWCTANGAETFHRSFNNNLYAKHPHMYNVMKYVQFLQEFKIIKNQRVKMYIQKFYAIQWNSYVNGVISQDVYLKTIGRYYRYRK